MKKQLMVSICAGIGMAVSVFAQGSLNPPGAPAPVMKTLAQVEPRTAITNGPVTISDPGSYYLANNIHGTITIYANDVTLDLMGFVVEPASGEAIDFPISQQNVIIRNGTLRGASTGLDGRELDAANCLFEGLHTYSNNFAGIYVGSGCVVRDCDARANGAYGIRVIRSTNSVVQDCRIVDNPSVGLEVTGAGAYVDNNTVKGNGINYVISEGQQLNLLLCEIPETLRWPCSVKLAGTLTSTHATTNGITVTANDVTIDLAGHSLVGPGATGGHGIEQRSGLSGLRVMNGMIRNWRNSNVHAIDASSGTHAFFESVQSVSNAYGLAGGPGTLFSRCQAVTALDGNGFEGGAGSIFTDCNSRQCSRGFYADEGSSFINCSAYTNEHDGYYVSGGCSLKGCSATRNSGSGFWVGRGSVVAQCAAYGNSSNGFYVMPGVEITECTAVDSGGHGIQASQECLITRNNVKNNILAGIYVGFYRTKIVGNHLDGNGSGIVVLNADNLVIQNSVYGSTPYAIAAGNSTGMLINVSVSGGTVSGDPWANIWY